MTTETIETCNARIKVFEDSIQEPILSEQASYLTGVDLGTACIVLCVLNEKGEPVAGSMRYANVVRDGMVVDYMGAIQIVRELKAELEAKLQTELLYAAAALPPGTDTLDGGAIKNVVQAAGFELITLLDEPNAANQLLKIKNGAVVDIGGGTTGISILENGQVVTVVDEATGGTHLSLVIAGAYKMSFEEAELYKRVAAHHQELFPVVKPVIEKIASIISHAIQGHQVEAIYLVGGTCCLTGIESVIEKMTGIPTFKPVNPMLATPLGIALSCLDGMQSFVDR